MDDIKDIVYSVIKNLSPPPAKEGPPIEELWEKILDEKESVHTKIKGVKEGHLFIDVDSSAWLYQIRLKQDLILRAIQKKVPDIQKISFRIGSVK